ncbi:MAG: DUF5622 domain-containing protein [Desulfurococcales archaeon]|nr:DUF5622 domain-containing protein [Desulfurococcales archaeon]
MGGKQGKYIYIKIREDGYVKARVFKNKADDDPDKYLVTGPKRSSAPITYSIIDIDDLPVEIQDKLLGKTSTAEEPEEEPKES